jgi:hypothetical protein
MVSMASTVRPVPARLYSGTRFVIACIVFGVAFVTFLVAASPRLLQRTLAAAPPPVPHQVGAGSNWAATAVLRGDDPCLLVRRTGRGEARVCTEGRERGVIQRVDRAQVEGGELYYGVVSPRVGEVRLRPADGAALHAPVVYADYGFPLGFWVAELPAGTRLAGVEAVGRDGATAARVACDDAGCALD